MRLQCLSYEQMPSLTGFDEVNGNAGRPMWYGDECDNNHIYLEADPSSVEPQMRLQAVSV